MTTVRRSRLLQIVVLVSSFYIISYTSYAKYSSGTGEPNDPYQIATAEDLTLLGQSSDDYDKHFELVADVNVAQLELTAPIISDFVGSLNGNGYIISGLTKPLFETIKGRVHDCKLYDAYIAGGAAILAEVNYGQIKYCRVSGSVSSYGGFYLSSALLVGQNFGDISHCSAIGAVSGTTNMGGLVGTNSNNDYIGSELGGKISDCYVEVEITYKGTYGPDNIADFGGLQGGLVGTNSAYISNCYVNGILTNGNIIGGISGTSWESGKIRNCYAVTEIINPRNGAGSSIGKIVGRDELNVPISRCYYKSSSGQQPGSIKLCGLTDDQMRQQNSFKGWDFYGDSSDGWKDHWFMPEEGYPVLSWQTEITGLVEIDDVKDLSIQAAEDRLANSGFMVVDVKYDYHRNISTDQVIHVIPFGVYATVGSELGLVVSKGAFSWDVDKGNDQSITHVYDINSPGQLESLMDHPDLWASNFALSGNINMAGRIYSSPIIGEYKEASSGRSRNPDPVVKTPFTGLFDGRGYEIANLHFDVEKNNHTGLFGSISSGDVQNLHLEDIHVLTDPKSTNLTGTLAVSNGGSVTNCHSSGTIISSGSASGLVGINSYSGTINNCSSKTYIVAGSAVGGIAFENSGIIQNCLSNSHIIGDSIVGGLVGENKGEIMNSYTSSDAIAYDEISSYSDSNLTGLLVATNSGYVNWCYAILSTGFNDNNSSLVSEWGLSSEVQASRLIGYSYEGTVYSSYYNSSEDSDWPSDEYGIPRTDIQLKQRETFFDWDFVDEDENGTDDIWWMPEDDYPRLWWENESN